MDQKVPNLREEVKKLRSQNPQLRGAAIAKTLGLSRERIRQILVEIGLPTKIEIQHEKKICHQCGAIITKCDKLCRSCFIKNGRIIVYCEFCKSPINRLGSWVRRSDKSNRYSGNSFCNTDHYYKYVVLLQMKVKAREGDTVSLLKRPHKDHKALVLKSITQIKRGRIYSLKCECGKQLEKIAVGFSSLKTKEKK